MRIPSKFELFDKFFGRFLRAVVKSIFKDPTKTVHHVVGNLSIEDSAQFVFENFTSAVIFDSKFELWDFCIDLVQQRENLQKGLILEFGVYKGESINFFAKKLPEFNLFGFDSFKGLEENWSGTRLTKGIFNLDGLLPKVKSNVQLVKGWFDETIPEFKKFLQDRKISILHIDSDTYRPAKTVLTSLSSNITPGTIIIFDEFFGYPNWRSHEFRAWTEYVSDFQVSFDYIGYTTMQVAILIK